MKEEIIRLLLLTGRPGMDKLIKWMEQNGFFTAPCSTQHHLCKEGGLAEHSMNVYETAKTLFSTLRMVPAELEYESIILVSLLHDIGKCGQFGKPYYIENWVKEGRATKSNPEPQLVRSTKKPFLSNAELYNVPHEIRSLSIIDRFVDLTEDEQFAILYHNGLYGSLKYELQGNETPLYLILHTADMWCSRIIENEKEVEE